MEPETGKPKKGSSKTPKSRKNLQTEKALQESEDMFRDLAEKAIVGIYLIQDETFKYVNPRLAEIWGYSSPVEIIGKKAPWDMCVPEDWHVIGENIRKRLSGEVKSLSYEWRGVKKNGEIFDVECHGSRTMFQGKPAVIGTDQDITVRKRAETLLRKAEEKYRGIFENALEGIFQSTPEGRLVAANPALAKMMGYASPEELIAANPDFLGEAYADASHLGGFRKSLEEDGVLLGFECEYHKKDGSRFWGSMKVRVVRDESGRPLLYGGMIEDITGRKKVEQQLRRLTDLYEKILDNAPVAVCTLDIQGTIRSVNPGLASLTDLGTNATEKLIGFDWLRNPFTVSCGLSGYLEKGLRGESFQLWDFPFVNFKGDRNLYMDVKGVPLKGRDGEIEGLLCIMEETTERVKTRAKLMQDAKMSFMWKLGAGIAHQLNNPLAMVVAYAEATARNIKSFQEEHGEHESLKDISSYLQIVEEEALKCKIVVEDLFNLRRKEGFEIKEVDINDLLENLLDLMVGSKANLRITRQFSANLPLVRGDLRALRQVFMNLVMNAVDAIERKTDGFVLIRTASKDGSVLVEVVDNGFGIPTSIAEKIFEPFFTTKESGKGVGLGLFLCRELLSDMGGNIQLESKPGLATTFFVTLPAVEPCKGGQVTI